MQNTNNRQQFGALIPQSKLVSWLFFGGVDQRWGSMGAYLEIYFHPQLLKVFVVGCGFHGASGVFQQSPVHIDSVPFDVQNSGDVHVNCTSRLNGSWEFQATLCQRVDLEAGTWELFDAKAEIKNFILRDSDLRSAKFPPPIWRWNGLSQRPVITNPSASPNDILCPECFGIGTKISMSIPISDMNSGATGY